VDEFKLKVQNVGDGLRAKLNVVKKGLLNRISDTRSNTERGRTSERPDRSFEKYIEEKEDE
jgi:hypothetical protein